MALQLYDSATRTVRPFEPEHPGRVGIYLCGATVQGAPHVGHLRSAIAFDILTRWLRRSGHEVTLVRNVTDIDDKIATAMTAMGVDKLRRLRRIRLPRRALETSQGLGHSKRDAPLLGLKA